MGVKSQEQSRDARWNTEVLAGIEQSEEVFLSVPSFFWFNQGNVVEFWFNQDDVVEFWFNRDDVFEFWFNEDDVEIPLLLALRMHDSEQCSSWCHRSDGQIVNNNLLLKQK